MKKIVLLFSILLLSCNFREQDKHTEKIPNKAVSVLKADQNHSDTLPKPRPSEQISLYRPSRLWITGDFNGDKHMDTLREHVFSKLHHRSIDSVINPSENEWDDVVQWYYQNEIEVYLATSRTPNDTLRLGTAQGLYCLINVGDLNQDGKDEIALVVDYCDYSSLNSCKIYSICNGNWEPMKHFSIHEGAFDHTDEITISTKIKGFLEKQNKQWFYLDYEVYFNAETAKDTLMQTLTITQCR